MTVLIFHREVHMTDHKNSVEIPLYVGAYNKLLELIKPMKPGSKLPPEEKLADQMGISRNTLRQALQIMHEDRLIYKRRGSGTYVSETVSQKSEPVLNTYRSLPDTIKEFRLPLVQESIVITIEDADETCSEFLSIPAGTPLMVFSRVFRSTNASDPSAAYLIDFIPARLWDRRLISNRTELISYAESQGQLARASVIPTLSGKLYAQIFNVDEVTPLVLLQQLVLDEKGDPLYLNKTYLNSQSSNLLLTMKRN